MTRLTDYQKGMLATALGVLIISPDGLFLRLIAADSWTLSFWRGLLIGISITVFLCFYYRGDVVSKFWAIGWPGLFLSVLSGVSTFLFVYALTNTSIASALFIVNTAPAFTALIAWIFLKEKVPARTWFAIAAVLCGIAIIAWGAPSGEGNIRGNLAALGIAIVLAINFSLTRAYKEIDMIPAAAIGGFLSSLYALPYAVPFSLTAGQWGYLLILGVLLLPPAFALLYVGPRYIPAPEVSLMLLLEAILSPLLVWLVIGENPGLATLIGGTVIVFALAANSFAPLFRRESKTG
ncbi:MAG: drug/metabolite transporter (DMT)-like permease [Cellvibrionaceae bacterium]|jgi:drug/metabolite transporter (DMT)-like permease